MSVHGQVAMKDPDLAGSEEVEAQFVRIDTSMNGRSAAIFRCASAWPLARAFARRPGVGARVDGHRHYLRCRGVAVDPARSEVRV